MTFRRALTWLNLVLDSVSFATAWLLSYAIRQDLDPYFAKPVNPADVYIASLPVIVLIWIGTAAFFGMYTAHGRHTRLDDLKAVIRTTVLAELAVMSVGFLFKEFDFARTVVILSGCITPILLWIGRQFLRRLELAGIKSGKGVSHVLVVGTGETAIRAVQSLQSRPEAGYRVVGFLKPKPGEKPEGEIANSPVLGGIDRLELEIERNKVDLVLFAEPKMGHEEMLNIISSLPDTRVSFNLVTDRFDLLARHLGAEWIGEFPVIPLKSRVPGPMYEAFKRFIDLALGIVFLVVSLPLWPVIALGIKFTSRGPVFILQDRIGKSGRRFKILKFRTMTIDTPLYSPGPDHPGDQRVTGIGRLLRRLSLDEMPQLLNVIKGDMSLVGPRPEMPFIVESYTAWQQERLSVKPGLTGLWQVLGRKDLPLHKHMEYDYYYIKNRSLTLDLTIILLTPAALVLGKGAY
ncbi:MAG: sugar transferase [Deltaproteobacteria bacterium]|nr:sugar transferase [Deltaproteobacteria bacterium]